MRQRAVVEMRGAEVAAGIAQRCAPARRRRHLSAASNLVRAFLSQSRASSRFLVDLGLLRGGQRCELGRRTSRRCRRKEGDVVHGIAPQTIARSDVESERVALELDDRVHGIADALGQLQVARS